jgi:hypothetical protein
MKTFFMADDAGASGGNATLMSGAAGAGAGAGDAGQSGAGDAGAGSGDAFSWANQEGALSAGWIDKLPETLRGNASLKVINSIPDLAKSYVETKKLIGTKLEMPGEGASPEAVASWRKTVGAPDKPEGYYATGKTTLRPEVVPEMLWNPETEKSFLAVAHKHHLPPAAVSEILDFYGRSLVHGLETAKSEEDATLANEGTKLRQAWGGQFESNLHLAKRVAETIGLDPNKHPIFTHADVVQAFAKMGQLISEDKLVRGDSTSTVNGSFEARLNDIMDPQSQSVQAREYRGDHGPERQAAIQQIVHQLMKQREARAA